MATSNDNESAASLPEGEGVSFKREPPACVWCEEPVDDYGDVCDIDCYSLLFAFVLRSSVAGYYDWELTEHPAKELVEQPWYSSTVAWSSYES